MEAPDALAPVAESDETGDIAPAESASALPSDDHSDINALLRSALTGVPLTSNPDATSQSDDDDAAASQSASDEDVSAADADPAGDQPGTPKLPRRAPKEIKHKATIESLQAEIARRDAEIEAERVRIRDEERQRILTEQQQASGVATAAQNAERYEKLIHTSDEDLINSDYDSYLWREDYKRKLNLFPDVRDHYEATTQRTIKSYESGFLSNMRAQIDAAGSLPGVDLEAFKKPGTTWTDMARQISEGAWKAAKAEDAERIASLEAELADAGRQALGSAPTPIRGGRSGSTPGQSPNDWLRRSLQQARG